MPTFKKLENAVAEAGNICRETIGAANIGNFELVITVSALSTAKRFAARNLVRHWTSTCGATVGTIVTPLRRYRVRASALASRKRMTRRRPMTRPQTIANQLGAAGQKCPADTLMTSNEKLIELYQTAWREACRAWHTKEMSDKELADLADKLSVQILKLRPRKVGA